MEEMLKQILEGQQQLNQRFDAMEKRLDAMDERFDKIEERLDKIEKRLDKIEADIEEMKEDAKMTRFAVNHIGDKLEELINDLNLTNVTAVKYR